MLILGSLCGRTWVHICVTCLALATVGIGCESRGAEGVDRRKFAQAIERGNVGAVQEMLNKGENPNETLRPFSALVLAVHYHRVAVLRLLLRAKADPNASGTTKGDVTPLIHSAVVDCSECATVLIENGAVVDKRDGNGETAWDVARRLGHRDMLGVLGPKR